MSNLKVVNVLTNEEVVFEARNQVVEFIASQGVTDNTVKTIQKKLNAAIKKSEVLYEIFKIEEIEGDDDGYLAHIEKEKREAHLSIHDDAFENSTIEEGDVNMTNNEVIENKVEKEEIVYDNPADLQLKSEDEIPDFAEEMDKEFGPQPEKIEIEGEVGQLGSTDEIIEDPIELAAEEIKNLPDVQKIEDVENPVIGEWYEVDGVIKQHLQTPEQIIEDPDVPVIEEIKETPSVESDEKQSEPEKPAEEEKPNKRRVGKGLIAFKDGKEFERFPSIKACALYFKELMSLPHLPFTPIMKSVRQDVDWNQYSFKHENAEDLHIPESLKIKLSKQADEQASEKPENVETPEPEKSGEVIEEIIEEIIEEPLNEEIKNEDEKQEA